jgi:hypothetical protein
MSHGLIKSNPSLIETMNPNIKGIIPNKNILNLNLKFRIDKTFIKYEIINNNESVLNRAIVGTNETKFENEINNKVKDKKSTLINLISVLNSLKIKKNIKSK